MNEPVQQGEFFQKLDKRAVDFLLQAGRVYNFKKNSVIFLETDPAHHFYFILEGRIKISRLNHDGKEVIIAILSAGNFFGEMGLLDGSSRSADALSEENTSILAVRDEDFFRMLEEFPHVSIDVLKELARRIRNSDSQIKGLSLLNARGKVASAILRWAQDHGAASGDSVEIKNVPTQSELASYVGLTRETFNRIYRNLQNEGFITDAQHGALVINNFKEFRKIFGPVF